MISTEPIAFDEALAFARAKRLLPTSLTSAELRTVEVQLKRRAVFSARMTMAGFLDVLAHQIQLISGGGEDATGRLRSIPEAKAQLREWLVASGYLPKPGEEDSVKDFLSDGRLQLIVETNVLDTMAKGRWDAGNDPDILDELPAWRLVRTVQSRVPRNWEQRWAAAGAAVDWKGAVATPWVALKNSPIWQALGDGAGGYEDTLGNPWPPFAFNSGMNVVSVPREECEQLGLLQPGETVAPAARHDLNESLESSVTRFDEALQSALAADPELEIRDGILRLATNDARARVAAFLALADDEGRRAA